MKLYLVRHGDAVSPMIDKARPLSHEGQRQVEALANFLATAEVRARQIYHSGILRARQTAEKLATVLKANVEALEGLCPDDSIVPLTERILTWGQDTVLVGHLPFMEILTSQLITHQQRRPVVIFETATMLCLEYGGNDYWTLRWLLPSDLLLGRL